jgi:hypothetical protein
VESAEIEVWWERVVESKEKRVEETKVAEE